MALIPTLPDGDFPPGELNQGEISQHKIKMGLGVPIPEGGPIRPRAYGTTILLIATNLLVYGISSFENSFLGIGDYWLSIGGFVPLLMPNPSQWYRIFTSMFLHADLFHILFNMYFLFIFGRSVESSLGKYRFLALYLASGIMASLFHTAFGFIEGPTSYSIPAIGASGAISGILGAYLMLYPGTSLLMILPVFFFPWVFWIKASYYILFWFATQVIYGFAKAAGGTAVFAHAGGLVAGVLLIYLLADRERIAQLRVLSRIAFTSYIRFGPRRTRGLGKFTKTLFSTLLFLLLVCAAYTSLYPVDQGKVKSVTVQYTCQGLPYSDYVGIRLPDLESQLPAIPLDKTRTLLNRLSAAGLLYNTTSRELKLVGWTTDLPLRLKLGSMGITFNVSTTIIFFNGFYDADGFLAHGEGSLTTRALKIFLQGGSYKITEGDLLNYEFKIFTQTVDLSALTQYTGMMSAALTLLTLAVVATKDREIAIVGED